MSELKLLKCISDKLCELVTLYSASQIRREISILCDVTTPTAPIPIVVRYEYATDGTVQTVSAFNLDLTPYLGSIPALRACETDQARYDVEEKSFCVNGAERVRISVFNAETNVTVPVTVGWFDVLGNAVSAPTGGDVVKAGACNTIATATETITTGTGNIPAGLKAVTIKRLTGDVTIGSYTITELNSALTLRATELDGGTKYTLPAIAPSSGTWQWIGLS